jgi:hypothetical protein
LRHQRAARTVQEQVFELAEGIGAEEGAVMHVLLPYLAVLGHRVEMVRPEPAHHLAQLLSLKIACGIMRHNAVEYPGVPRGGPQQAVGVHCKKGRVGDRFGAELLLDEGREAHRPDLCVKLGRRPEGQAAQRLGHAILHRQTGQLIADGL